ncbi:MAG: hypothetical protein ABI678_01365 [Kofleriaceae bacterium]
MKKLLVMVGVVVALAGAWRWQAGSHEATDGGGNKLLVDRLWIDHVPRNEREMVQVFVVLSEEPIGVFDQRSMWTGSFEAFKYTRTGGELRVVYPQTGKGETIKVKARKCSEGKMDFCLELDGGKGAKRYYSREGWELRSLGDEQRLLGTL